jgi:hypothetical protein
MLQFTRPFTVYVQEQLLFRPVVLSPDYRFRFDHPFEEHFLDTPDGARLNLLFFKSQLKSSRGLILYFHGNKGNLQRWGQLHADFTERGYDFMVPDYRGYGNSTGKPAERTLFEDARQVYEFARERYPADRIVLYGRSLGSGMASFLSAHVRSRSLILETPFDNIKGLFAAYLKLEKVPFSPAFNFPNDRHLRMTQVPVLIFHGKRDRVVPFESASRLKEQLKPGDQFVEFPEGNHGNLRTFEGYQQQLTEWLDQV